MGSCGGKEATLFGFGLDEYLTLVVDPLLAALVLRRWGFRPVPTGLAWLVCTALALTLAGILVAVLVSLLPKNASAAHWTPVVLAGAATLLAPRALLLRKVSRSSVFRNGSLEPLGWCLAFAVSAATFAAAMLIGSLVSLLPRIPA